MPWSNEARSPIDATLAIVGVTALMWVSAGCETPSGGKDRSATVGQAERCRQLRALSAHIRNASEGLDRVVEGAKELDASEISYERAAELGKLDATVGLDPAEVQSVRLTPDALDELASYLANAKRLERWVDVHDEKTNKSDKQRLQRLQRLARNGRIPRFGTSFDYKRLGVVFPYAHLDLAGDDATEYIPQPGKFVRLPESLQTDDGEITIRTLRGGKQHDVDIRGVVPVDEKDLRLITGTGANAYYRYRERVQTIRQLARNIEEAGAPLDGLLSARCGSAPSGDGNPSRDSARSERRMDSGVSRDSAQTRAAADDTPLKPTWVQLLDANQLDEVRGVTADATGAVVAGTAGGNGAAAGFDSEGSRGWLRTFDSSGSDMINDVATAPSGAVYAVGATSDDLGGERNAGQFDVFLVRFERADRIAWGRLLGTPADEYGNSVAVGPKGAIYVTGFTRGAVGPTKNQGIADIFVAKFDRTSSVEWVRTIGTPAYEEATGISVGDDGGIYVGGYIDSDRLPEDEFSDFAGARGAGDDDVLVAKFDATGEREWVRIFGSTSEDVARSVATGEGGRVYVAGHTRGALGGGTNAGGDDAFIAAFDSDGSDLWRHSLRTSRREYALDLAIGDAETVYVSGATYGNLAEKKNAGGSDAFLAALDSGGNRRWIQLFGSADMDRAEAVGTSGDGSLYLAGWTRGTFLERNGRGTPNGFVMRLQ